MLDDECLLQIKAMSQSTPPVANPSQLAAVMAAACGWPRFLAIRPGNCPTHTTTITATTMIPAIATNAMMSKTSIMVVPSMTRRLRSARSETAFCFSRPRRLCITLARNLFHAAAKALVETAYPLGQRHEEDSRLHRNGTSQPFRD
jgi:hypothetical protein